jgi:hypothetical protein
MNTAVQAPWVSTELPKPNKKPNIVEAIVEVIESLWENEHFRALATSTDKDDSVEGSVTIDKHTLALLVRQAAPEGSVLHTVTVGDIARRAHHAQRQLGISRTEIAAKKAAYLQLMSGEGSTNS